MTEKDPRWLCRFLVPVLVLLLSRFHARQWEVLAEYCYILHGFHGHRPFTRSLCAVVLKSVASLFVCDNCLSLGEGDGVSVLNNLVYADKGCCAVVRCDLDFVVSDVY